MYISRFLLIEQGQMDKSKTTLKLYVRSFPVYYMENMRCFLNTNICLFPEISIKAIQYIVKPTYY